MRTEAVPVENPARFGGRLPEAWPTGAYLSMLAIASWSAAGETRNKPVYGKPSSSNRGSTHGDSVERRPAARPTD